MSNLFIIIGGLAFAIGVAAATVRSVRRFISDYWRWHGRPGPGSGPFEAGKPMPVGPTPPHHLAAAKDLPSSDKTHSLPKD